MTSAEQLFAGLNVVELADNPAGEWTGKLFADFGADVIKVEPPDGATSRHTGPYTVGERKEPASLSFWYYNTGKKSIALDMRRDSGRTRLDGLLDTADIVISTLRNSELAESGLDYAALRARNPRLIFVSVTPFGLSGPWSEWTNSDLVALALGSPLSLCGYDDHSIPPIRPGGDQGYQVTASFANVGAMLALVERQTSGRGQLVDIAMHDCLAVSTEVANPYWFYSQLIVQRQTCRHAQPRPTQPIVFRCADGKYVCFMLFATDQKAWPRFVEWLDTAGLALDLAGPEYLDPAYRQRHFDHIQEMAEAFFLLMSAQDAYYEGQRRGFPIGVLNAPEDVLEDPHLRARDFFATVTQSDGTQTTLPRSPLRFSAIPPAVIRRAPELGEHDQQVSDGD